MLSKQRKNGGWDFQIYLHDEDLKAGFITKERFIKLVKEDLQTGGYEITKVYLDSRAAILLIIKYPEGVYELVMAPQIADIIYFEKAGRGLVFTQNPTRFFWEV